MPGVVRDLVEGFHVDDLRQAVAREADGNRQLEHAADAGPGVSGRKAVSLSIRCFDFPKI